MRTKVGGHIDYDCLGVGGRIDYTPGYGPLEGAPRLGCCPEGYSVRGIKGAWSISKSAHAHAIVQVFRNGK